MIVHILKLIWNKRGQNALMILEIFLSFLVIFFALAYIFFNLEITSKPLGFETEDRWMIALDGFASKDSLESVKAIENLRQNLLSEEEIIGVSFTTTRAPFWNSQWRSGTDKNGFPMNALRVEVDEDFVDVLGLNVLEGRGIDESDGIVTTQSVMVNKIFMDEYYPEKSMIDSIFFFEDPVKIVGVVEDYRYFGQFEKSQPIVFLASNYILLGEAVVLHMKPNVPASYEEELAGIVQNSLNSTGSVIMDLETEKRIDAGDQWLLFYFILGLCGFLCLNVALGLFGILWYSINKRKAEIGLRQAMGANGVDISKQFILEALVLTGIALIIGIFFAIQIPLLQVTEYDSSLFYKSILFTSIIILVLVFTCALFPSLQAARISPSDSLHED